MISKYARGMVYWADIPTELGDCVQTGKRPVVVVSNNLANMFAKTITVVPCTSNINKKESLPTHCATRICGVNESVILCENVVTINKEVLGDFIGILDDLTMTNIDKCLKIALGLDAEFLEEALNANISKLSGV